MPQAYWMTEKGTNEPRYDGIYTMGGITPNDTFSYINFGTTTNIVFDITIYLTFWYTGKNSNLKREDLHLQEQRISLHEVNKRDIVSIKSYMESQSAHSNSNS